MKWLTDLEPSLRSLCIKWSVPLGVAVGWVQVESGGRIDEVTSLDERGYFQLMPAESKDLKLDHNRLTTNVGYSLNAGFVLIGHYRSAISNMCAVLGITVPSGSEYQWRLVKLAHSMGQGAVKVILGDAIKAQSASSWSALMWFAVANNSRYLQTLHHSPIKWFQLVDKMFEIGRPYGLSNTPAVSDPPVAV